MAVQSCEEMLAKYMIKRCNYIWKMGKIIQGDL